MLIDDAVLQRAKCKGYLKKQGGGWKTWKNRFFVLDDTTLYYLDSPKERVPLGVIYLQGLVIEGAEQETKWKWSFSITTQTSTSIKTGNSWQERKYIIQASDEKDYKMWLDALRNAVFVMKQSAVGVKDAPSNVHVRGSKPTSDRVSSSRALHTSRSTDPTPSVTSSPAIPRQASSHSQPVTPRRVFSADADVFNNRLSLTGSGGISTNNNGENSTPTPPSLSGSADLDARATFRRSVFEKAVNGLFVQPSSEITPTITEKDKKASLLRNASQRGSGIKPNLDSVDSDRSPSPSRWEKAAVSLYQETSQPSSPKLGNTSAINSNNNSNPTTTNGGGVTKQTEEDNTRPPSPNRELHVLITPWNELAKESLFALLKLKATNPAHAKCTLRVRIMASTVPERTREELVCRGVQVTGVAWDDEQGMKDALKDINKVLFLPGQSHYMENWANAIIKASRSNSSKITQFIRVGVVGMEPPTCLGLWGQAIDSSLEREGIISTTVLLDQLYQEICPAQGGSRISSPFTVPTYVAGSYISPIDARDVAVLLGTILLADTPQQSSDIMVNGPATVTYQQLAQIMSDMLDMKLCFSSHPPTSAVLREMFEVFKQGGATQKSYAKNNAKLEGIIGRPLYTFESFLSDCVLKRKS